MDRDHALSIVRASLEATVPEADGERLEGDTPFRDQFPFDSVDYLHLALRLEKAAGVTIPESDYPLLATLNGCAAYLVEACGRAAPFSGKSRRETR
jgi:acyl carrier protein